jgi:twitching motility two-component system response regulator PilH
MAEPAPSTGKRVLIVEDEPDISLFLAKLVGERTPHVLTASDGAEGLATAKRELPDLVILDMKMPQMNGLEVVQALLEDPATASLPVLILTSTHFDAQTRRLFDQIPTVKAFLQKSGGAKRLREQLAPFLD